MEEIEMPMEVYPFLYTYTKYHPLEVMIDYQLDYLVSNSLMSIEQIEDKEQSFISSLDNRIQQYRFFVDHLLFLIGQINDYFVVKERSGSEVKECVDICRKNYNFVDADFPILSNKQPRNIMEHLIERNCKTINQKTVVGGFNVLFSEEDIRENIENNKEFYPYYLDTLHGMIMFYDVNTTRYDCISLEDLKKELKELRERIKRVKTFLYGADNH